MPNAWHRSVLNLSRAFVNFFEGRARYPRFKSKHKRQSLQYPQNVKLEGDRLHLPKIGEVYCRVHRWFDGTIKTVTVSRHPDGRYSASILIDDGFDRPEPNPDGKAIGIDLGLKHFAVTSDGKKYNNPRHLKKHERNLKRKQRKLSRKQPGSNSRRKAKRLVARVYSKIANSRADFLHKLSHQVVNENQVIVVENLAVKNLVKNHSLAKAISDVGWGMFSTMLKYKAEAEGKVYLEVNRFFPSTHLCSETLLPLPKMGLDVRSFECPHCGQLHDRDINAAINLKNEGLRILRCDPAPSHGARERAPREASGTGASASGGNVRPKGGRIRSTLSEAIPREAGSHSSSQGD